jgi:hypothetical protein
MKRLVSTVGLAAFVLGGALWAEDTVYFNQEGQKKQIFLSGTIEKESTNGIQMKTKSGAVKEIATSNIVQIEYGSDVVDKLQFRAPDNLLIKAQAETRPEKKAEQLRAAQLAFETLDRMENNGKKLSAVPAIHRYLQYRIAQIKALQARLDVGQRDAAIAALVDYKNNFGDGWEIVPALQLLASLQVDKGENEAASQTYTALAALSGLAPELKLQSQLQSARLLMRANKFADAESRLTQIESALSRDASERTFVSVYLMQSRIAQKSNLDGIDRQLTEIVRKGKDEHLLALAHNVLGDFHRAKNDNEGAFWEYCKVDLLYDRDREEHAKALYYLSKLFAQAPHNNADRAKACRDRLLATQFDGTLYQRLAAAEK